MYGEWLYAKHTVFYDCLPHYFLEFDVWDREGDQFLSTTRRRELLRDMPVCSVPVLACGPFDRLDELLVLIGRSRFKSGRWRERLHEVVAKVPHVRVERVDQETDPTDLMEGLYVKREDENCVLGRYKYVRASFLQAVVDASGHWLDRPIVPNRLHDDADLFSSESDFSS